MKRVLLAAYQLEGISAGRYISWKVYLRYAMKCVLLAAYQLEGISTLCHEMCTLNDVTKTQNNAYTMGCKIKESVRDYPQGQGIFFFSFL